MTAIRLSEVRFKRYIIVVLQEKVVPRFQQVNFRRILPGLIIPVVAIVFFLQLFCPKYNDCKLLVLNVREQLFIMSIA